MSLLDDTIAKLQNGLSGIAGALRKTQADIAALAAGHNSLYAQVNNRPRTITEEIDAIPGRRIEFTNPQELTFDITQLGQRGNALTFQVSQDGPFVMTHYPLVAWRPSAPSNATNLGRWRPVSTWPVPTQAFVNTDWIDIGYEIQDGGSQRLFQSGMRGPILSRPDNLAPLPVPTLFAANAVIQFYPTFLDITFDGAVPPTAGILHVDLPGYRIVNL